MPMSNFNKWIMTAAVRFATDEGFVSPWALAATMARPNSGGYTESELLPCVQRAFYKWGARFGLKRACGESGKGALGLWGFADRAKTKRPLAAHDDLFGPTAPAAE